MNCQTVTIFASLFLVGAAAAGTFPELSEVPAQYRLPAGAKITIDADGNYVYNGEPRYLLGVQAPAGASVTDVAPTSGYPDELKWLYDKPLNYESAQRLGFDTISTFAALKHLSELKPALKYGDLSPQNVKAWDDLRACGLPSQLDFTCFPWGAGSLTDVLAAEAVNPSRDRENNHWVPYNIFHPAGRQAYVNYWKKGAEENQRLGGNLLMYELFNEPGYDDDGAYNRQLFVDFLRKKYGTIDKLNAVWHSKYPDFSSIGNFKNKSEYPGLRVDWSKFMEQGFTDLCKLGVETIRAVDPNARFCVQMLGPSQYRILPHTNVNIYEINRFMQVVALPTGGGVSGRGFDAPATAAINTPANSSGFNEGILQRKFYLSIADGKPIENGETYIGGNYKATFNTIYLDFMRGSSATYLFEWSKRAWDWKPAGTPEGGKKIAEQFPYMVLNPYAYPAEDFRSIMDAKKEIFKIQKYFARNQRQVKPEIALMLSYPTERYSTGVGKTEKNEIIAYAGALEFSHEPWTVLVNEEFTPDKLKQYRFLVAAGVNNLLPGTMEMLTKYVKDGGVLILARDFMQEDEYGNGVDWQGLLDFKVKENAATAGVLQLTFAQDSRLPGSIKCRTGKEIIPSASWKTVGSVGAMPAVLEKSFGKGKIYLITPELQDYAVAAVLGGIFAQNQLKPVISITRDQEKDLAVNVEAHVSRQKDMALAFLYNWDNYPKLVRVKIPGYSGNAYDIFGKTELPTDGDGALVLLEPTQRMVIGVGDCAQFGPFAPADAAKLTAQYDELNQKLAAEREKKRQQQFRYKADLARLKVIDLRSFCNRGFVDSVSDDGVGGWTDQGRENSLVGVPWGVTELLGIPCDLIRYDQNDNKTCIVLASQSQKGSLPTEVKDIPVNAKVRALYFFQAVGWYADKAPAMTYRIHYASGETLDVPVVCGVNIWDWWVANFGNSKSLIAWRNLDGRGFYCWRWGNPKPEEEVRSLDIISANNKIVPIVIGITAEEYDGKVEKEYQTVPLAQLETFGFSNAQAEIADKLITVSVSEKTGPWAGFIIRSRNHAPAALTEADRETARLHFFINGGKDKFGNDSGKEKLQFQLCKYEPGKPTAVAASKMVPLDNYIDGKAIDNDPETFQEVIIPLKALNLDKLPINEINGIMLQFRGTGADSGVIIRDLVFEK